MNSPINLKIFPPSEALSPLVHSIQVMEAPEDMLKGWQKVVPYGLGAMVIHYREPYAIRYDSDGPEEQLPQAFMAGLTLKPFWLKPSGTTGTITVNLLPATAWKFLKTDMKELSGKIVDLQNIFGPDINLCLTAIRNSRSDDDKIKLIEDFLSKRVKLPRFGNDLVDDAVKKIDDAQGIININILAKSLDVSVSKLERHFRKKIGMTPKVYSSIYRFNKVFRFMKEHPGIDIHDVLYLCGYYDQPHFIRDFTRYAGETPRSFFLKVNAAVDVYSGK